MNPTRLDTITRLFADRKLSRRQSFTAGAGLAVGTLAAPVLADAAQEATPIAPDAEHGPEMLFVQSFQSGSIAPSERVEGRYTITLDHGLGETIYFSDRPERIVGSTPTAAFLNGLGFPEDNPPNAAILTESATGETTLAVVELFDPVYDAETATLTYDVSVLEHWQDSTELAFTQTLVDVSAIGDTFGTAHLFIDDCSTSTIMCLDRHTMRHVAGLIGDDAHDGWCYSWSAAFCLPCQPWLGGADLASIQDYWNQQCNATYTECKSDCFAYGATSE
ncbi:MAG: hypothetical protein IT334_05425 [Thermomicrobiales bacterium]|nr:hypothetical protein [Thermomicrobiales bacterium]